jgi:hypothetical protein
MIKFGIFLSNLIEEKIIFDKFEKLMEETSKKLYC